MPSKVYRSRESLGKLGESVLASWVHSVGYVLNGSLDDRAGWDGLLESPPDAAGDGEPTLGHRDAFPLRARIQVKATDKPTGRVSKVALTTWLRLAETPDPAFFLVLEMNGQDHPQAVYLVHVGEDEIRGVLEQQRQSEVAGVTALHKVNRSLAYLRGRLVEPLSGRGLLAALDAEVEAVPGDYATWKRTVVRTAGFEDGHGVATLTPPPGVHPVVQVAELEVGLRTEVPFAHADIFRQRFGLRDETPLLSIQGGTLVGPPPTAADAADVVLSVPSLAREASARAELFVSPSASVHVPDDPEGEGGRVPLRVRLRGRHVSVTFRAEDQRFDVSFEPPGADERVPLRGLHEMVSFVGTAVAAQQADAPIEIQVHTDRGGRMSSGPVHGTIQDLDPEHLPAIEALLDGLWSIAQAHRVEDQLQASLKEVLAQAQIIGVIDQLAEGSTEGAVEMRTSYPSAQAFQRADPDGFPFAYLSGLTFGEWHLISVVQFGRVVVEHVEGHSRTLRIPIDAPRILHRHTRRPSQPAPDFFEMGHVAARVAGERILFAESPHVHIIDPDGTVDPAP
ncbi:MAG TPA: hypothetical protein EYQ24_11950 [Bacteroidetes bacterium]|nr:hypothetical protein [Rhodothermaceae bacterium]MBC11347.1 hypothetical protein [Rhodothermaceae bacterium]HIG75252.1 hypothetical protein [Bacteroidota bacterium]HIL57153.1 hypothetical protein [Rhodothermales bacterium]